jgi:N utilization substance protein B
MALPQQKFREIVFQALYSLELGGSDKDQIISMLMKELQVTKRTVKEAFDQADKIIALQGEIDALIAKTSTSYAFERIQTVEKNILRLSCYELLHCPDVPAKVAISEGMRLARKFGTPESANFVNALLDAIYKESQGEPKNVDQIKILAETLQKNEDLIQEKMESLLNAEKSLETSDPAE